MTIKAILFDAYGTLFDVYSVKERCEQHFQGKGEDISRTWREKQLEYCFLTQILQKYEPFDQLTEKALKASLAIHGAEGSEKECADLMKEYEQLRPFEETEEVLKQLKGKQTFIYSNGTRGMLDPLIKNNGFQDLIGALSADEIRQYKPSPASYSYAMEKLGLDKAEILFVSSNQWDIAGASSFGFRTAWINRTGEPVSALGFEPASICSDLKGLLEEKY
ncbi:haloacid dehalogenase type II [Metabacillus sp. FJAT-52054]|uniref:Haloacid dehalogenase type II n=1 Tax=Metabacillus sediminis TaxID=3117746 RepID=A0ABZ2NFA2_9BACI